MVKKIKLITGILFLLLGVYFIENGKNFEIGLGIMLLGAFLIKGFLYDEK